MGRSAPLKEVAARNAANRSAPRNYDHHGGSKSFSQWGYEMEMQRHGSLDTRINRFLMGFSPKYTNEEKKKKNIQLAGLVRDIVQEVASQSQGDSNTHCILSRHDEDAIMDTVLRESQKNRYRLRGREKRQHASSTADTTHSTSRGPYLHHHHHQPHHDLVERLEKMERMKTERIRKEEENMRWRAVVEQRWFEEEQRRAAEQRRREEEDYRLGFWLSSLTPAEQHTYYKDVRWQYAGTFASGGGHNDASTSYPQSGVRNATADEDDEHRTTRTRTTTMEVCDI